MLESYSTSRSHTHAQHEYPVQTTTMLSHTTYRTPYAHRSTQHRHTATTNTPAHSQQREHDVVQSCCTRESDHAFVPWYLKQSACSKPKISALRVRGSANGWHAVFVLQVSAASGQVQSARMQARKLLRSMAPRRERATHRRRIIRKYGQRKIRRRAAPPVVSCCHIRRTMRLCAKRAVIGTSENGSEVLKTAACAPSTGVVLASHAQAYTLASSRAAIHC